MTRGIGDVLNLFQKVKLLKDGEYQALCPCHNDKTPSLHIRQEDNHILINCKAGCTVEAIVESVGLQMTDLFIDNESKPVATKTKETTGKIVKTYDYKDESGKLLYQVVRYDPKSFRQRKSDGNGGFVWDMKDVRRVLYRLPEIAKAETLYLTEGEKDADTLWDFGQPATTSVGGANNWQPEYADSLVGKNVIIIPDRDAPGMEYARQVAQSLENKAKSVKVILLDKKDITEWIESGNDVSQLPTMERPVDVLFSQEAPAYQLKDNNIYWKKKIDNLTLIFKADKLKEEKTGIHAKISVYLNNILLENSLFNIERSEDRVRLANAAYKGLKGRVDKEVYSETDMRSDLTTFCNGLWDFYLSKCTPELQLGDESIEPMKFLLRPYILDGGGTILFAPPGMGKSYTALLWAISIDAGCNKFWGVSQAKVLFINLERSKQSLSRRLSSVNNVLGLPRKRPIFVLNARGQSLSEVLPACRRFIAENGIKMIVLDSISRAGYGDLNENQPVNKIIDALSSLSPSWLALGHTSRSNEDHLYGSIMADAGADICVRLSSEITSDFCTLGIGWDITKQNDIPRQTQEIIALEFDDNGLINARRAKAGEFHEVEGKRKKSMEQSIADFILSQDGAEATATEIEAMTGFNRSNISALLNRKNGTFTKTRKDGKNQYYGVRGQDSSV